MYIFCEFFSSHFVFFVLLHPAMFNALMTSSRSARQILFAFNYIVTLNPLTPFWCANYKNAALLRLSLSTRWSLSCTVSVIFSFIFVHLPFSFCRSLTILVFIIHSYFAVFLISNLNFSHFVRRV